MPASPTTAAPTGAPSPSAAKIQRWIDLLAALLVRNYPASFEELARDVPAYSASGKSEEARMRMFERDKDELRTFGVPVETISIETDDGPRGAYRLRPRDFYLPYLCVAMPERGKALGTRRIDRHGYRALTTLAFEPDELAVVAEAAARVRTLGDPLLAADIQSAVRKLAVDLPLEARESEVTLLAPRARPDERVFEVLSDALSRRKAVEFDYHAMSTDRTERRAVEPYGLFFLSAHWYLVGRDRDRGELRNFRLDRITDPAPNAQRHQTPDYDVPDTFRLREHARSRHAWELGDGDALDAVVEFRAETGVAAAAARLGAPVPGEASRRRFQVRRLDAFARWLLSFGGDAVPIEPPALMDAFREQVLGTTALYAAPSSAVAADPPTPDGRAE